MLTLLIADASSSTCDEIESFCDHYANLRLLPSAHNGKEALLRLEADQVDVLLMDIVMPVLDGLSVLNQIQFMEPGKRPAVFIHTAFLDNRLLQELQKLNVVYCFVKPMGPEYLVPRILQLMRARDQGAPSPIEKDDLSLSHCSSDEINTEITRQIRAVGVPAHLRGYHYLRSAILYTVEAKDPSTVAVTKDIYPYISKQFNTRPPLVERAIRNAIEVAWTRGNTRVLHQYFGYTIDDFKGKPTNAEFIAMIADRVRMAVST